ncbi:adenylate cyclase [Pelomyxa schiedti]|nr:adenylate cyclase [Pelomyxa schiedti]
MHYHSNKVGDSSNKLPTALTATSNNDDFLDVIGVPVSSSDSANKKQKGCWGSLPLKVIVPGSSVAIVLCVIVVCLVPMTQQWNESLNTVSQTAKSNLLEALELYRRSLVVQAVANISSVVQQAPNVADLIEGAIPEEAFTTDVTLTEDSSKFRQILKPINIGWKDFVNLMVAFQNSNGDHDYNERFSSGFYVAYDSVISLSLVSYKYIDGVATKNISGSLPNYNFTKQAWWKSGLSAIDGAWTNVYKDFSNAYTMGYTKRVMGIPVPAVIQITITLVSMRKYFTSMNLTETGSAFLVDSTLQVPNRQSPIRTDLCISLTQTKLMAATPGLNISFPNGTIMKSTDSSEESIGLTAQSWLHHTNQIHQEAHFVVTLSDKGPCYADVVPITADGGLVLWLTLVTPESDFLSNITAQQDKAEADAHKSLWGVLAVELFIALCTIVLSISLAVVLASALKRVTTKLHGVSRGKFSRTESYTVLKKSAIKEIDMLNTEVCSMQSTLESFSQYVPTQVVRHLCKYKLRPVVGFRGMKCVVMFLDVVDFTKNMDAFGAQTIIEVLSVMFEAFSTIITRNSGTIDKYIGDAIMALWGCPETLNDPEMRSCVAVDEILEELAKLNAMFLQKFNITMHIRIGLHYGEVKAGNVGSSQRLNYTVLGNTVNLAARLEPLNKEFGTAVLVTDSIRNPCCKSFSFRALGKIFVRGFQDPILVHEFVGSTFKVDSKTQVMLQNYAAVDQALCSGNDNNAEAVQALLGEFIAKFPIDNPAGHAYQNLIQLKGNSSNNSNSNTVTTSNATSTTFH